MEFELSDAYIYIHVYIVCRMLRNYCCISCAADKLLQWIAPHQYVQPLFSCLPRWYPTPEEIFKPSLVRLWPTRLAGKDTKGLRLSHSLGVTANEPSSKAQIISNQWGKTPFTILPQTSLNNCQYQVHLQKEQLEKVSALGKQRFPKLMLGLAMRRPFLTVERNHIAHGLHSGFNMASIWLQYLIHYFTE